MCFQKFYRLLLTGTLECIFTVNMVSCVWFLGCDMQKMNENLLQDPRDERSPWKVWKLACMEKAPAISRGQNRQKEKAPHSWSLENSGACTCVTLCDVTPPKLAGGGWPLRSAELPLWGQQCAEPRAGSGHFEMPTTLPFTASQGYTNLSFALVPRGSKWLVCSKMTWI